MIYFYYAPAPWGGPWSTPHLIFNAVRDMGRGVFIYDTNTESGPAGPVIDPSQNNPTNTAGATYAAYMIERFTRVTNSTLNIYYTMSTWNPYTVIKMRSSFTIQSVIDPQRWSIKRTSSAFHGLVPPTQATRLITRLT